MEHATDLGKPRVGTTRRQQSDTEWHAGLRHRSGDR
jgi:hypothetical protein